MAKKNEAVESKVETPVATPSADVTAMVEQNQKLMEQVQAMAAQNAKLLEQVTNLTLTTIAAREVVKAPTNDVEMVPSVEVENVSHYAIAFSVTDPRSGNKRHVRFDRKGEKTKLFREQVEELRAASPHFFSEGYLSAPTMVDDNPNVVRDINALIASLDFETVDARIDEIDSKDTLYAIFHHIQSQRFTHTDAKGNPLTKDVNGKKVFFMEERKVDAKTKAVEVAVQRRISAICGEKPVLDA